MALIIGVDRIEAMEKFISLIEPKRDQVAELLMWEIGKKRSDAEKEFDRTVVYLKDTIEEYKNLHREGSHISQVSGVLAQIRRGPSASCCASAPSIIH